jgi:hypothetical protein
MEALGPDELAIHYQLREFGPLKLDELYTQCFVDRYPPLKPLVDRALSDLLSRKVVVLENGLYTI